MQAPTMVAETFPSMVTASGVIEEVSTPIGENDAEHSELREAVVARRIDETRLEATPAVSHSRSAR